MNLSSKWKKALVIAGIVSVLIGVWIHHLHRWCESVQPGGSTLAEVLAKLPDPVAGRAFTQDGHQYLALLGPVQTYPKFPSGPPVYIFDSTGQLIDWTADEGDDEAFRSRWSTFFRGRALTPQELHAWPNGSSR